jgi:hypothetical protein
MTISILGIDIAKRERRSSRLLQNSLSAAVARSRFTDSGRRWRLQMIP